LKRRRAARLHFTEQAAGSGVGDGGPGRAQDAAKLFARFAGAGVPVGNLEYAASGLVFLTNDGDLAAEMLKNWAHLEQVYHVKVKGMLTLLDLERLGKEIGVRMQTVRQPDATRGRAANFWYEVRMRDSKKEELRRILFKEMHPLEKLKRIGLGRLRWRGFRGGDID